MKKVIFSIVVVLFVTLAVGLSVAQLPFEIPDDEAPAIDPGGGDVGNGWKCFSTLNYLRGAQDWKCKGRGCCSLQQNSTKPNNGQSENCYTNVY